MDNLCISATPLWGSLSDGGPTAVFLEMDRLGVLLDCGAPHDYDVKVFDRFQDFVSRVDIVLLSHGGLAHCGALPYLRSHFGLKAPVFATRPTITSSQMELYELYLSFWSRRSLRSQDSPKTKQSRKVNYERYGGRVVAESEEEAVEEEELPFSLDAVDEAFENIKELGYRQTHYLSDIADGVHIVAYPAGHTCGGSIWEISMDGESVVYCLDFNHVRERLLNGATLMDVPRPHLFITSAATTEKIPPRKEREALLRSTITEVTSKGGSILIPIEVTGRCLELCLFLDDLWNLEPQLRSVSLCFLSTMAIHTLEFAKSQLEWCSRSLTDAFEHSRQNPFDFRHLRVCTSKEEFYELHRPTVVLATNSSLEQGFSRDIFLELAASPINCVVTIDRCPENSLGRRIAAMSINDVEPIEDRERVGLEGTEKREEEERRQRKRDERERKKRRHEDGRRDVDAALPHAVKVDIAEDNVFHPVGHMLEREEKEAVADEYGEFFELDDATQQSHRAFAFNLAPPSSSTGNAGTGSLTRGQEAASAELEGLYKIIVRKIEMPILCSRRFIDFEGRSDLQSQKTLLTQWSPKRVLLLRSPPDWTEALQRILPKEIDAMAANDGQAVFVLVDSAAIPLTIAESVLSASKMTSFPGVDVQRIVGEFQRQGATNATVENGRAQEDATQTLPDRERWELVRPSLRPKVEAEENNETTRGLSTFVGEIKISELLRSLSSNGVIVTLQAGTLQCRGISGGKGSGEVELLEGSRDGPILATIRKVANDQLSIEGCLSRTFFAVRRVLYNYFERI